MINLLRTERCGMRLEASCRGGAASQPGETGKARITPLIPAMSLFEIVAGSFCFFKMSMKTAG